MTICLIDEIEKPKKTACNYIFCKPCLTEWLKLSNTCPICRNIISPDTPTSASMSVRRVCINNVKEDNELLLRLRKLMQNRNYYKMHSKNTKLQLCSPMLR